jgi:two-component system, LytTR family, response regulator
MSETPALTRILTRVLIVDDEPLARDVIRHLLTGVEGMTVIGECRNGVEAVDAVQTLHPDLMFLDIQMPDLDGFGVLRALLPDCPPTVVLVTAYDEFAVQAFEAEALDFLVKPFTDERFHRALDRARKQSGSRREADDLGHRLTAALDRLRAADAGPPVYRTRFLVSSGRRSVSIPVASIVWIAADDYYARLHLTGVSYLLRRPLTVLEHELDPRRFVRVHRGALVNMSHVRELYRGPDGRVAILLLDGTRLPISERRRAAVLRAFAGTEPHPKEGTVPGR